jgi:hypothetical protein
MSVTHTGADRRRIVDRFHVHQQAARDAEAEAVPRATPCGWLPAFVDDDELRLVKRSAEFISKEEIKELPRRLRGIYVLYKKRRNNSDQKWREKYDVVYVGMATAGRRGGIRGRLMSHARSKRRGERWTHFSAFVVWDNIRDEEVTELEGLFRHIYRRDSVANALNIQRGFKKAKRVRVNDLTKWRSLP